MATGKGVIQGYAAQAAVDSSHQVILAADVTGSGSGQSMLVPLIEQTAAYREAYTLVTADAGYHSDANAAKLMQQAISVLIADSQMRQRDERLHDQVSTAKSGDRQSCALRARYLKSIDAQWHLYGMEHNIEKLASSGWRP